MGSAAGPQLGLHAIAAGKLHSVGLRSSTAVTPWAFASAGSAPVPAPNSGFVSISTRAEHTLALRADGSVAAWGQNIFGQCNVPAPNANFASVGAGSTRSFAVKSDGTALAWGQGFPAGGGYPFAAPVPNSNFTAIVGSGSNFDTAMGLKSDGSIVCAVDPPGANGDFIAIAGGTTHYLGLKSSGEIVAWGSNAAGQLNVPSPNAHFAAIAAGNGGLITGDNGYSMALRIVPGDVDGDGRVNVADLLAVIAGWGPCAPTPTACPADFNHDGLVNVGDLLTVISNWG